MEPVLCRLPLQESQMLNTLLLELVCYRPTPFSTAVTKQHISHTHIYIYDVKKQDVLQKLEGILIKERRSLKV